MYSYFYFSTKYMSVWKKGLRIILYQYMFHSGQSWWRLGWRSPERLLYIQALGKTFKITRVHNCEPKIIILHMCYKL